MKTIDHIGIAVRDIDSTISFYEKVLLGTLMIVT